MVCINSLVSGNCFKPKTKFKDKELTTTEIDNLDENKRDWEGTALIAKWCREKLTPQEKPE